MYTDQVDISRIISAPALPQQSLLPLADNLTPISLAHRREQNAILNSEALRSGVDVDVLSQGMLRLLLNQHDPLKDLRLSSHEFALVTHSVEFSHVDPMDNSI